MRKVVYLGSAIVSMVLHALLFIECLAITTCDAGEKTSVSDAEAARARNVFDRLRRKGAIISGDPATGPCTVWLTDGIVMPGGGNWEGDDGALKLLEGLPQIESVVFQSRAIGAPAFATLPRFPNLHKLQISGNTSAGGWGEYVSRCEALTEFSAWTEVSASEISKLGSLRKLRTLDVIGTKLVDKDLEPLWQLTSIEVLALCSAKISDRSVQRIRQFPHLRDLDLYGTGITDGSVELLAECRSLERLRIAGTKITKEGVARLRAALPKCKIATE